VCACLAEDRGKGGDDVRAAFATGGLVVEALEDEEFFKGGRGEVATAETAGFFDARFLAGGLWVCVWVWASVFVGE
jgi:hypothetical protein